ncbi:PAS domain-containing hybrid sensor histidine kinase/response regulator [Heliophilum fasciatum]|nr:PAS domain S-box protein [Heliophilum fasciatum]MCW2278188.1 PAS domain S-box-containing protein [Heliophilum fasciatum]
MDRARLASLEKNYELYRTLAEAADDYIFLIDRAGILRYANQAFAQRYHLPVAALVGNPMSNLFPGDTGVRFKANRDQVLATGNSITIQEKVSLRNGDFWLDTKLVPIKGANGQVDAILGIARDITERHLAEEARKTAEIEYKWFSTILEASVNEIYILYPHTFNFRYANASAINQLGYSMEELTCMTPFDIMPSLTETTFNSYLASLIKGEQEKISYELFHQRKDGSTYPVEIHIQLVHYGDTQFLLAMGIDVTERRQAQLDLAKSQTRYHQAIEASMEGFGMFDNKQRIIDCNESLCHMLEYEHHECIGKNLSDFLTEESIAILNRQYDLISLPPKQVYDFEVRTQSGKLIPTRFHVSAHHNEAGELVYSYAFITNMSDTKQIQADLFQAKEGAEKANLAKSNFLATMSHEIRTPLNGVIGLTELLLDTPLEPQQREIVESIIISANLLLAIINDILDFSKIEAGKMTIESIDFNLYKIVQETAKILLPTAMEKGLLLNLHIDPAVMPMVNGDPIHLKQILFNLIGNAIKFTEHGRVEISLTAADQQDGAQTIRFAIQDTGIGISEENQCDLFEPFIQGEKSTTRKYGGTGLGLAITNRLVQLMHGDMGVQSHQGKGTCFWFTITFQPAKQPMVAVQDHLPISSIDASIPPAMRKVLLVEDNVINITIASTQLEKLGFSVTVATNGQEALDALSKDDYSLVFMDCQMPVMDGYEATRRIRQTEKGKKILIIAMTAFAMQGDREKCLAAGMDDYLSKPLNKSILQKMLQRWLKVAPQSSLPVANANAAVSAVDKAAAADAPANASPDEQLFAGIPTVDFELLKEYQDLDSGEQPSLVARLLETFLGESKELLLQIEQALNAADAAKLMKTAHSLKSASAALGALRLSSMCAHYEAAGRANDLGKVVNFSVLRAEWTEVRKIFMDLILQQ